MNMKKKEEQTALYMKLNCTIPPLLLRGGFFRLSLYFLKYARQMKRSCCLAGFFLFFLNLCVSAKIRLPHILCDNMVLQQQADVQLWGWAKPKATVSIKPSWGANHTTIADKDGRWSLRVHTPKASYTPLSITFSDGEAVTLHNILAGEVWVCAGQSNMEMPLKGFDECTVEGYQDAVADAGRIYGMRYVKIPSVMRATPQDDADCHWQVVDSNTANYCSAVGYFFARRLHEIINVPIGLILANKGGTIVESWLDENNLKSYTKEPVDSSEIACKYSVDWLRPLLWGNGTFHPIINYSIRGILYYQGCSNVGRNAEDYAERLSLLISQWRRNFNSPNLPFYFVEIAPHSYGNPLGIEAAFIRAQQQRVAGRVNNTVLIGTNDLVYPSEIDQIHPCQKRQIGERLAMTAAARDYGFDKIFYRSPSFERLEIRQDSCFVHLKDTYNGVVAVTSYEGFEIAGQDKVYYKAHAQYLHNNTFLLTSSNVSCPVAVRYCYHNFQLGNVKNQAGLPLLPFKTD